ncbi:hypothetical protein Csa_017093 [Cucumis sativus]|nr:hypothetical protein Csa_017093 [Cucumis sativus]
MDCLISTKKDVRLLEKAGIIVNDIDGSDKEVSELFNNLSKFVRRSSDISAYFEKYFNYISKALCENNRNRQWKKLKGRSLKHNYFNTPWADRSLPRNVNDVNIRTSAVYHLREMTIII